MNGRICITLSCICPSKPLAGGSFNFVVSPLQPVLRSCSNSGCFPWDASRHGLQHESTTCSDFSKQIAQENPAIWAKYIGLRCRNRLPHLWSLQSQLGPNEVIVNSWSIGDVGVAPRATPVLLWDSRLARRPRVKAAALEQRPRAQRPHVEEKLRESMGPVVVSI